MPEPEQARFRMSARARLVLLVSVVGLLLLAALGSAIGALQRTVYSPGGLVTAYLAALSAHDAHAALALPGVDETPARLARRGLPSHPSRQLLRGDVLGRLSEARVLGERSLGDGRVRVQVAYRLDERPHRSSFTLRRTGSVLGLLPTWRFAVSPLAVAHISVLHASTFTLGGKTVDVRAASPQKGGFSTTADYLVFAPSMLRLDHESRWLTAQTVNTPVTAGATVATATVAAEASDRFVSTVRRRLDHILDECVTQRVLKPTGCPMGVQIDDRVRGAPEWRMVGYPRVVIVGGRHGWSMPATDAVAHLTVHVQSLFDGALSTRDEDVPFTVSLPRIAIRPNGSLRLAVGG